MRLQTRCKVKILENVLLKCFNEQGASYIQNYFNLEQHYNKKEQPLRELKCLITNNTKNDEFKKLRIIYLFVIMPLLLQVKYRIFTYSNDLIKFFKIKK